MQLQKSETGLFLTATEHLCDQNKHVHSEESDCSLFLYARQTEAATGTFDNSRFPGRAMLSLDPSKAFDKVSQPALLKKLLNFKLPTGFILLELPVGSKDTGV